MARTKRQYRGAMPYKDALEWLIANDDMFPLTTHDFESGENPLLSVTMSFVADCYGRTDDELLQDLLRHPTIIERMKTDD